MRTLKSAQQRNCLVAKEFYTDYDLNILLAKEPAVFYSEWKSEGIKDYRVDLTMCKTISVIYDKIYELYVNVVVTNSGNTIYVDL